MSEAKSLTQNQYKFVRQIVGARLGTAENFFGKVVYEPTWESLGLAERLIDAGLIDIAAAFEAGEQ